MRSESPYRSWLLTSLILTLALIVCESSQALTCSTPTGKALLAQPALIFLGVVQAAGTCNDDSTITRYRIKTLYKGFVEGDTVEVESGSVFEGCSSERNGETRLVLASYNSDDARSRAQYFEGICGSAPSGDSLLEFLPYLEAYRLSLQKAYKEVDRHPKSTRAWEIIFDLQNGLEDHIGAMHTVSVLRGLEPRNQDYAIRHADILVSLERYKDAAAAYDVALSLGTDNERIQRGRVRILAATDGIGKIDTHLRNYTSLEVENNDFSDRELDGAVFVRAQIKKCQFDHTNLRSARFEHAFIRDTDFRGARMSGAQLQDMSTDAVTLNGADLSKANLQRASLYGCKLVDTDLTNADLTGAVFENADLTGAKLSGAKLTRANFIGAKLPGADLSGKDLRAVQFQGADLRNVKFVGADLRGAYFSGLRAELRGEDPTGRSVQADLRGADLSDAVLWGADLNDVRYDCHTKFPRDFNPRKLKLVESDNCPASR